MNKKGFTLIELLVSITLIATISYFLFQIIFIVRDIYIEKTVKSELYIETANASNLINKDIISKMNNGISVYGANKISSDAVDLVFTNADVMQISIDRTNNKIKYGTYSVDISKDAKIGNINLYYNFDENDLEKNGVFFIKIPVSLEKYNTDFSIYIYSRYNSSSTIMGGEVLAISERCDYENGYVWNFDYTGGVQQFDVPCTGLYKLEVWGAQGGDYTLGAGALGGKGGYSTGNVSLSENDTIYIIVGGQGISPVSSDQVATGGYNGGGIGSNVLDYSSYKWQIGGAGGGGASHIALTNRGELFNYNSYRGELFLIAAGGGGAGANSGSSTLQYNVGGYGGGSTGGNGTNVMKTSYSGFDTGRGGTQTAAGCSATTSSGCGSFGKGGNNNTTSGASQGAGGGAGYFGGGAGRNYGTSGGGGSSWVGNLTDTQIIAGNAAMPTHDGASTMTGNTGNGYAKITLISS